MATNFPTSLDAFTNPTAVDTLDSPPHDVQHADANDAIEALQAKVGVDGSAVTDSLDYKVANFTNKLGSGAAVRTLGSFVGGDVLQAAELNAIPADAAQILFGCATGGSVTYNPADVSNSYYGAGAYASVTRTTGTSVLIIINAVWGHVGGKTDNYSVNITGASSIGPSDDRSIWYTGPDSQTVTATVAFCQTVTAGSNTFKINAKHQSGGYAQTVNYTRIQVIRLN